MQLQDVLRSKHQTNACAVQGISERTVTMTHGLVLHGFFVYTFACITKVGDIPETHQVASPKHNDGETAKRPVPQAVEKVSPLKKMLKATEDGNAEPSCGNLQESQQEPAPAAGTDLKAQPEPRPPAPESLLQRALDRIQHLEEVLKQQNERKEAVTPLPPALATPTAKHLHSPTSTVAGSGSTSGTTPSARSQALQDEDSDNDAAGGEDDKGGEMIVFPNGSTVMSQDALRMRLRRLCEKKPRTQKCHVDDRTHDQWIKGGEDREWLEIALVEALQKVGPERTAHKKLKVTRSI